MLQNAYLGAKIGFDAEENEPSKVWWFGWKIGVQFGNESFNLGHVQPRGDPLDRALREPREADQGPLPRFAQKRVDAPSAF